MSTGIKVIAQNKKARHDFFIIETYEAGIELFGTEVKSIRLGKINLKDSYASIHDNQLYVHNMHISPYEQGNIFNKNPLRERRLLMHKREIIKLLKYIKLEGYTLVPLSVYLKKGLIKLELAVAKGKKLYDKREAEALKQQRLEADKALKENRKNIDIGLMVSLSIANSTN